MDKINENLALYGKDKVSKSFIFVDFNVTEVRKKFYMDLETKYMVYGNEICPDTKKPHLQGFVTMIRAYRWNAFKKLIGGKTNFAIAKAKDAGNYCMKDMDYVLKDSRKQGARSDLIGMGKMVENKESDKAIYKAYPASYMRYYRSVDQLRRIVHMPDVKPVPTVRWHFGDTATGKTRWAFDHFEKDDIWLQGTNRAWFNGYYGQKVAIFDDIRIESASDLKVLLRDTDRYDFEVEVKGGFGKFRPEIIIITCPRPPSIECDGWGEDPMQMVRRCETIEEFV